MEAMSGRRCVLLEAWAFQEDLASVVASAATGATTLYARLLGLRCNSRGLEVLRVFFEAVARVDPELDAVILFDVKDDPPHDVKVSGGVTVQGDTNNNAGAPPDDGLPRRGDDDDEGDRPTERDDLSQRWVAVGGTFDHLHAGHRLLLAATALAATERVFVGIAGDELLKTKKFAAALESFAVREANVVDWFRRARTNLQVDVSALLDPADPPKAATMAGITGLVVSVETLAGAERLAEIRKDRGIDEPLHFLKVGLIAGRSGDVDTHTKLSSTALREQKLRRDEE